MARLWSCGFELQSATAGVEWDSTTGSPTINTTTKRSGAASLRVNPTATTAFIQHTVFNHPNLTARTYYFRFYLYIASSTDALDSIFVLRDGGSAAKVSLRLNSDRTLELWNDPSSIQIGSDSSALSTGTWYRIEIAIGIDNSNLINSCTVKIDGTTAITGTPAISSTSGDYSIRLGAITSTTCDIYFDDIAINDSTGSSQTTYPGAGSIVHMKPNAAGDNNAWLKSGGGAGDSSNYQDLDETTPDDATTYVKRTSTGTHIDDYNLESSSSAGIGAGDTITLVAVGFRGGSTSAIATARDIVLRIKGQASGTLLESSAVDISISGWITNSDPVPRVHKLVAYTNPQDSAAWEPSDLDSMQIGFKNNTSSTNEIRMSAIWALVEYVPSSSTNVTVNPSVQAATFSIPTPTIKFDFSIAVAVLAIVASIITPTVTPETRISPSVQTATFATQAPSVVTNQVLSVGVQSASFSLQSPTASAGVTVSANAQAATFSLQSPTVVTAVDVEVSAAVQAATFNLQAPAINLDFTVSPSAQVTTFSTQAPTVTAQQNVSVSAGVQSATFTIQSPTLSLGAGVSPAAQTLTFSTQAPTLNFDYQLTASTVGATFSVQSAVVGVGATVSPTAQSAIFSTQAITVSLGATINPSAQGATFSTPAPTVSLGVTINAGAQTATFSILSPTVTTQLDATIQPSVLSAVLSLISPTTKYDFSIFPSVQIFAFTIQTPTRTGPFYTDKYINQGSSFNDKYSNRGSSYSDKHSGRGTSYSDKHSSRSTSYNDKYSNRNTPYNDKYEQFDL